MKTFLLYPTEEQENMLHAFLETNNISFFEDGDEELPQHVLEGIKRGQEDVKAGRTITLDEFKKKAFVEQMNYEVVISEAAEDTFEEIRMQVENKWGAKYADQFEDRVAHVLDLLSSSPFIFKSIPFDVNIRKAYIHRNCSMFYEIHGPVVIVLFFWDNRQDPIFL